MALDKNIRMFIMSVSYSQHFFLSIACFKTESSLLIKSQYLAIVFDKNICHLNDTYNLKTISTALYITE